MPLNDYANYRPNLCACGHDYTQHNIAGNTCTGCPSNNAHAFSPDAQLVSKGPFAADGIPNYIGVLPHPESKAQQKVGSVVTTMTQPSLVGATGIKVAAQLTVGQVLNISANNAATQEMAIVVSATATIATVANPLLSAHASGDTVIQVDLPLAPAGANVATGQRAG